MKFVIVTGMSGGGKRTALKMLEDIGFYCVDNLPVALIGKFVELIVTPGSEVTKVALGIDVRKPDNPLRNLRIFWMGSKVPAMPMICFSWRRATLY